MNKFLCFYCVVFLIFFFVEVGFVFCVDFYGEENKYVVVECVSNWVCGMYVFSVVMLRFLNINLIIIVE